MEQQPANTLTSHQPHSPLTLPLSPPMSPLPLSPTAMPTLQSSSFEPSPFTLPSPATSPTLSSASSASSSSVVARRSYRRRRDSSDTDAAGADEDTERKRRRQEQNRRAAATSRVNNKLKRDRLEQQVTELERSNERLKRLRQTLTDDNSTLASSTSASAPAPSPLPSLPSSPARRVGRSSSRESAVLVSSLPWNTLQLIRNKPNIQRAITAIVTLSLLLILCTATVLLLFSSLSSQTTASRGPPLPLSRPPTPSFSSPLPPLLLLSSLLSLSASPLLRSPPSLTSPTPRPPFHSSLVLTPHSHPPLLRLSRQRRRLTLSRPSGRSTAAAMLAVESVRREGISAEALVGVQLRTGRAVTERVWARGGGVRFQGQLRGTNASVSVNERAGSPPWLLAMLMVTAMVS